VIFFFLATHTYLMRWFSSMFDIHHVTEDYLIILVTFFVSPKPGPGFLVVDDKDRLKWHIRVHVLGPKYVDSEIV
jgi:hypothetical protein